jgi:hypothetical protein
LGRACIRAALGGNDLLLIDLHKRGVALDVIVNDISPATAAARMGHTHVLQRLLDNNIDL